MNQKSKTKTISGRGRKRPMLDVNINRLHLDPDNPRVPTQLRSSGQRQKEILSVLKRHFDLEEIAYSMAENGYFDEEPLIAIPQLLPEEFSKRDSVDVVDDKTYLAFLNATSTEFTVVEGNRRLATAKVLLSDTLKVELRIKSWPQISDEVREDLGILPVIVYTDRKEVLPYLGVRHIAGIKKWDAFSKAQYIADTINQGYTIDEIQKQVGDRSNSAKKIYFCYRLIQEVETEFDLDTEKARNYFSYLLLSAGQGGVKEFLGLPRKWTDVNFDKPVPNIDNLRHLFSWLFGEGSDKLPVIKESRDITNYLSPVLRSSEAIEYLTITRNLQDAYDRSEGEKHLLLKNLHRANRSLESALGILNRYKTEEDVKREIDNCQDTLSAILKILED